PSTASNRISTRTRFGRRPNVRIRRSASITSQRRRRNNPPMTRRATVARAEVIVVGAGLAGLSAAIYLGRAGRQTLVIDSGKSMARWEPSVENYLGFPDGVRGEDLLRLGREQARRFGARFVRD